jgi:hypothetical protein
MGICSRANLTRPPFLATLYPSVAQLLTLLSLANGSPIIAKRILGEAYVQRRSTATSDLSMDDPY